MPNKSRSPSRASSSSCAALDAGFRAIRLDVVRDGGPSAAELVARNFAELREYLLDE